MNRELAEAFALDEQGACSFDDLARLSGVAESLLRELVHEGALDPIDPASQAWTFRAECVVVARRASRLQRDFELDVHALALVLRLHERIGELEAELRAIRAQRAP